MFAIFIQQAGKWEMWLDAPSKQALAIELDYLVNSLGVKARIFKKI